MAMLTLNEYLLSDLVLLMGDEYVKVSDEKDLACAEATRLADELERVREERDLACAEATRMSDEEEYIWPPYLYTEEATVTVEQYLNSKYKIGNKLLKKSNRRLYHITGVLTNGTYYYQVNPINLGSHPSSPYLSLEEIDREYIKVEEMNE